MTTQTSRLEIIIDTDRAKKGTDDTVKSLNNLEKQGDKTQKQAKDIAKSIDGVGKSSQDASPKIKKVATDVKSTGDEAKTASSKFTDLKNSIVSASNDGKFGGFSQKITSGLSGMSSGAVLASAALGGAFVAGVGLAALGLSTIAIETAKADMQLQMLADRANTSVKNFQILEYASRGLGVSQDQLGSMLADVQEKLGEFSATEGGGAADFFDALKNNTKMSEDQIRSFGQTLQGKDGVEAIQMINNKMDELGATGQERRFVFESLASDLGNLAPLFAENGKTLDEFGEALEEAGVLKPKEAMEQSRLLAAQTQSLDLQFQGMKNQLTSAVMPAVSNLMGLFVDTTNSATGLDGGISIVSIGMNAFAGIVVTTAGFLKTLYTIARESMVQLITVGATLYNVVTAGSISGAFDALKTGASVVKQSLSTIGDVALDSGKKAIDAFSGIASTQSKLTQALLKTTIITPQQNNGGLKVNTKQATNKAKNSVNKAKVDNTAQREAERLKREAEREQKEIERLKERITKEFATKEQRLLIQYEEAKADIQKGFVNDPTSRDLYLAKAKDVYDKEVADYKKAQQEKFDSFKRDFADKVYSSQTNLGLMALESQYGRDSFQYKSASLGANTDADKRSATESFNDSTRKIEAEYDTPERAGERYALLEEAKRAHVMRMQEIDTQHHVASRELIEQQKLMQLQAFSSLTGSMMGLVDESSSAYQALFAMQKGMNFAQALMNGYTAISAAWASAPFPYNMGAVALATVESGVLQSAIQAVTPRFATGGHVHGAGTGTSDSIDAKLSNGEFVMTAEATKRIGVDKLNAANKGSSIENTNVVASQPNINLNPNFVIVDERENVGDYLFSSDGTKAFVKFFKRNKTALGF